MLLPNKVAVIYGAGGAVGSTVARTLAREGVRLFLTGHSRAGVDELAAKINAAGGYAEAVQVDALEEKAVEMHLNGVIEQAGKIDISFNAVGLRNTTLQGIPLTDLALDQFMAPIQTHVQANFITARLAGRLMAATGSGGS